MNQLETNKQLLEEPFKSISDRLSDELREQMINEILNLKPVSFTGVVPTMVSVMRYNLELDEIEKKYKKLI